MKLFKKTLIASLIGLSFTVLHAQAPKVQITDVKLEVDKPDFEDLKSPDFSANTKSKKWNQKEWLEMEVKFVIEDVKPKIPKDETLPELTVKWFVVAQDPNNKGKYVRLTKEVKHVNIPIGEDIYTSVYISPSGVRRLSGGGDAASKRLIFGVGGEIYFNGKLKAIFTSKNDTVKVGKEKKPFWYSPALSDSKGVQLHDKNETPFKFLWWDRYAEIASDKKPASAVAR